VRCPITPPAVAFTASRCAAGPITRGRPGCCGALAFGTNAKCADLAWPAQWISDNGHGWRPMCRLPLFPLAKTPRNTGPNHVH